MCSCGPPLHCLLVLIISCVSSMASATELQAPPDYTSTVTVPGNSSDAEQCRQAPFPVVVLFSGFMLRAAYYKAYAERLAGWGYAVVQYDAARWPVLSMQTELTFLPQLVQWAREQKQLQPALNWDRIAVAGHSRGGKLAALHLASDTVPGILAAYLIDPVDTTREVPESPENPSAAKALRRAGKPVAITGAKITGSCNPNGSNWKHFYSYIAPNSWLGVVHGAGHGEFADAGWLLNKAFDLLCRAGHTSRQGTMNLTLPPMLAWLDTHLQPAIKAVGAEASQQQHPPMLDRFFQWIQQQVSAGTLDFRIKEEPDAAAVAVQPATDGTPSAEPAFAVA